MGAYLAGNNHNLTKAGANDLYLVNVGNAGLSNVVILAGRIGLQNNTSLGTNGTLTLAAGGGLDLWDMTVTNTKTISLTNATISSSSSTNVYGGNVSLNGTGTFTATTALQLNGSLTGTGAVVKNGASLLTLAGSSTYTGNTTISNGVLALIGSASIASSPTLDVTTNAQLDVSGLTGTFTLAAGQTLKGVGSVKGSIITAAGSTIAPGESYLGRLTVSNNITLGGTNIQVVSNSVSTKLIAGGSLTYGGTLVVNNLGTPFGVGSNLVLFAATSYSGAFANISPATPGTGLAWDTSALTTSGTLKVINGMATNPTNITATVTGNALLISWPADHLGWTLQMQTNNLNTGLSSNWVDVQGTAGTTSTNITIDVTKPTVFFRLRE